MTTKKLILRLLIFFIGIPLIIAAVLFVPQKNHLFLNLIIVIFSALGAYELKQMLAKKQFYISFFETIILGSLVPLIMAVVISFNLGFNIVLYVVCAAFFWIFISRTFLPISKNEHYFNSLSSCFVVLIYPGAFLSWICAMGKWNGIQILIFLLVPIMNDSLAWTCGHLFGKNNRGIVKISPKKSIAGFIGGLTASVLTTIIAVDLFPEFFVQKYNLGIFSSIILGLIPGIAAIFGDLCESAMKRSSMFKDSGSLIPGRGGVLDSVDSIAMAAPAYYITWLLLFMPV